jgi:hypothetical protein
MSAIFSLMAHVGVLDPLLQRALGCPGHRGAELEAPDVQYVEGDLVPLADLAEQVLDRYPGVVQDDLGGRGPFDAELLLLGSDAEPLRGALHEERGELFLVDLGEDRVEIGDAPVGGELLGAV